jgi:hypothetical protein
MRKIDKKREKMIKNEKFIIFMLKNKHFLIQSIFENYLNMA